MVLRAPKVIGALSETKIFALSVRQKICFLILGTSRGSSMLYNTIVDTNNTVVRATKAR